VSASATTPLAKLLSTLPRQQIPISKIQVPPQRRCSISMDGAAGLIEGFRRVGQLEPILVRKIDGDGLMLIAGRQRLGAAAALGWDRIDARVIPNCTDNEARMIEISENLHRHELTAIERAEQIDEWRQLCKGAKVAQVAPPSGGEQPADKGIRKIAKELGVSRREVERAEKIASITPAAKEAAKEAGIDDNQSKLLEVAAAPAEKQVKAVEVIRERRKRKRKPAKAKRKHTKPFAIIEENGKRKPITEEEATRMAEESYQQMLYDQVCLMLEQMSFETWQRLLAHIKEKYAAPAPVIGHDPETSADAIHAAGGGTDDNIFADAVGSDAVKITDEIEVAAAATS
jgi:ParB-like nuclease family protein